MVREAILFILVGGSFLLFIVAIISTFIPSRSNKEKNKPHVVTNEHLCGMLMDIQSVIFRIRN